MTEIKYTGIDQRKIKCCDERPDTKQSGISFDHFNTGENMLRFHFLDYTALGYLAPENMSLRQRTVSMMLNKKNTKQLIKALKELKF